MFPFRRHPTGPDQGSELQQIVAQRAMTIQYSLGLKQGARTTLMLLLGRSVVGGIPFKGIVADDVRAWAELALKRLGDYDPTDVL